MSPEKSYGRASINVCLRKGYLIPLSMSWFRAVNNPGRHGTQDMYERMKARLKGSVDVHYT